MPPESTRGKAISPIKALQDAIRTNMYNAGVASEASRVFICEHNLDEAWRDHDLRTIFPSTKFSAEERKTIRERFLRVLSILILIGWSGDDLVNKFRSQFLRAAEGREDKDLPLDEEKLGFLDTSSYIFWQLQFAFCPAIIEESDTSHLQRIDSDRRLPFTGKPREVGGGAYGSVSQVTIAPRCLRHKGKGRENFKPLLVACKTYTNENSAENFRRESENLDILKRDFRGSKRVMQHIASIIHGNNFMILLPLAEHGDLEIFLRDGYKPGVDTNYNQKSYDFNETFPQLATEQILHKALLKEMFEIASALVWLHDELHIYGKLDRYLAHLDLKPENILVAQDDDAGTSASPHPAGKWMLTDFGVSVFDKATNQKATRVHSIRDVGPRLTSRANMDEVMRGHGTYQPPEVDLDTVDGRKCDVWSLACILCDVLAFAFGRGGALYGFRSRRYDGKDDFFYRARGSSDDRSRMISSSNTELKSEIKDWLQGHPNKSTHSWVAPYISIIQRALMPRPLDRPNMKDIMHGLNSLPVNILPSPGARHGFRNSDQLQPPSAAPQPRRPSTITFTDATATPSRDILRPDNDAPMAARPPSWEMPEASAQQSPTFYHYRDQSIDSSNTEVSSRQNHRLTVDTISSIPIPISDKMSPYPLHRLQPLSKASKYEVDSRTSLNLNNRQSVDAIAVTPTGDKVAFLYGTQLIAYLTRDGSRTGSVEELTPPNITPPVKWIKVCIANKFAVTYGIRGKEKLIKVRQFETTGELTTIPITFHNEQASDVLLSNRNVVVCVYTRWLYLASLSSLASSLATSPTSTDTGYNIDDFRPLEIGGGKGPPITATCFSDRGDLLFVWASGDVHHGYVYRMDGHDAALVGEATYEKAPNDSKDFTLWPYESIAACIVHNSHGSTFVIQPSSNPRQKTQRRQSLGIPSALVARVIQDNILICIHKSMLKPQIFEYGLSKGTDGHFHITKPKSSLGAVERSVDQTAKVAILVEKGQLLLVLCTTKGEILKYKRKS